MRILSIETSCDETAVSIAEASGGIKKPAFLILANNIASQIKVHRKFGGVVPMLAKREHLKNLPVLFKKTLKEAKINEKEIDLIAVTYGPGLEPALWVGVNFAKALSQTWNIPVIPVNHMLGHFFSVMLRSDLEEIKFPALALLVSGGHTELILSKKFMSFKKIGATRDDAAGEAFDKVARLLGLPYPGGPEISKLAEQSRNLSLRAGKRSAEIKLPRPMIYTKDFDFSFSGLKTAVLYLTQKIGKLTPKIKREIAREFEDAAVEVLVSKTLRAAQKYKIKTLIVAGGVAANQHLRQTFETKLDEFENMKLLFPARELTTDNSIMIALAGYFEYLKKGKRKSLRLKPRGNLSL